MTRARLQRRTLRVLVGARVLSGLGGSAAAAGALLALDITGSEALAGLPLTLLVLGAPLPAVIGIATDPEDPAGMADRRLRGQREELQAIAEQHVILRPSRPAPLVGTSEPESRRGRPSPDRAGAVTRQHTTEPPTTVRRTRTQFRLGGLGRDLMLGA